MRGKRKPEDTDVATEETGPDSSKKRLRVATTHRTAKARKESELRQVSFRIDRRRCLVSIKGDRGVHEDKLCLAFAH